MSDTEKRDPDDTLASSQELVDQATEVESENEEAAELPKLNLDVKIDSRSACERHITVSVSREDIDRYFDKEYSELMPAAQVPGFRPGHAPRKLVEHRFRKDVAQRVKSSLLMDSLTQIHDDQDISAISEPDIDIDAVEVPDEGPMTLRVRSGSAAGVRDAAVEGSEAGEAGPRVHRRRRGAGACKRCWPIAAGWCRSTGRPKRATTSPPT